MGVKIWIGNIPEDTTNEEIRNVLREYGPVLGIEKKTDYCFVELEDQRTAEEAVKRIPGSKIRGVPIKVQFTNESKRKVRPGEGKIRVENLPFRTQWQDVKDHFRKVGRVSRADIVLDDNGRSAGAALLIFEREEDARRAVAEMDQTMFSGNRIRVTLDKARGSHRSRSRSPIRDGPRGRSPSPRRGRSRSRSRSRDRGRDLRGRDGDRDRDLRGRELDRLSAIRGSRDELLREDFGDYRRDDLRAIEAGRLSRALPSGRLDGPLRYERPPLIGDERGVLLDRRPLPYDRDDIAREIIDDRARYLSLGGVPMDRALLERHAMGPRADAGILDLARDRMRPPLRGEERFMGARPAADRQLLESRGYDAGLRRRSPSPNSLRGAPSYLYPGQGPFRGGSGDLRRGRSPPPFARDDGRDARDFRRDSGGR